MGMYDHVKIEVPLPEGKPNHYVFQTKDFDCLLHNYIITKNKTLIRDGEEIDFHGWLYFYGGPNNEFNEYDAKFTDGKLVELTARSSCKEKE